MRVGISIAAIAAGLAIAPLVSAQVNRDFVEAFDVPIPDNDAGGTFVDIIVTDDAGGYNTIDDLNVDIIIDHTWQGDLIIEVEKVGGPRVPLIYRAGDSDAVGAGFSANNFGNSSTGASFIFDDEAGSFYDSDPPDGIGGVADPGIENVDGSWIPYGAQPGVTHTLSAFDGLSSTGTWRLHVSDNAGADTGSIRQFSLHFTNVPTPATLGLLAMGAPMAFRRRR